MDIKHNNIFYIRDFSEVGGVETFVWEMVKKFKDLDIAVVYKNASPLQVQRVKQYCKTYCHVDQKIICKVAIINYDVSIIDYIDEKAKIYQVIHGDYSHSAYDWKPPTHDRITQYIAVTKYVMKTFKELTGLENVTYGYNPLTIEKQKPYLTLLSATRLSKIKGVDRMIKLATALDNTGIDYIWYVFTNSKDVINMPNVIFMKNRLDVGKWFEQADYLVQLSDTEACSYAINEALYRNIPVIVTPLPYLKEIGVEDNKNAYIMDFDCSNVEDIVMKIQNKPKFEFEQLEDNYYKILAKGKSKYKEELKMKAKVRATKRFEGIRDAERDVMPKEGEEWITTKERAEFLESKGVITIVEIIEDKSKIEKKVTAKKEEKKEVLIEKPKTTRRKRAIAED